MTKTLALCFAAALALTARAQSDDAVRTITVTVENPLNEARTDAPVVISLHPSLAGHQQLEQPAPTGGQERGVRSAVVRENGNEIPCQLDDLDGDRRYDELCFVTNLARREKKTFTIELSAKGRPRHYEPRVFIEMVLPNSKQKAKNKQDRYISEITAERGVDAYRIQHHHGVAFESELTAYRIYFDHRQSVDLYGKKHKQLELRETQFYPDADQLARGYGDDVLWCGQTFALGAFRGWNGSAPTTMDDAERRTQRIIARGPVRVIAETVCEDWNAPCRTAGAEPITVRERYTQWAGHRDVQVDVVLSRPVPDYDFSTGIINVKGSKAFSDGKGLRGCWGSDYTVSGKDTLTHAKETVGLGICIPQRFVKKELPADKDNYGFVVATPSDRLTYHITFTSDKETFGYHNDRDWFAALKQWKRELEPLKIEVR